MGPSLGILAMLGEGFLGFTYPILEENHINLISRLNYSNETH